ncbi:hypothetical protein I2W78_14345 [Streptomyces spinoverrucosus]|uniref:hypothetical protein n=1 Tax=Streptomyces spinoverrucosus TaxID=284043 RepID=UPI0018C3C041|nr:hypothetical protein [Streptomyces spinoverrucosus]MBG0852995.1 hypothetical protein [Streptomyces spinoverrucosus]
MGEGRIDGGVPDRRRARPHAAVSEPGKPDAGLAALLGTALRDDGVDAEAEQRAVTAYLAARDAGAHRARTRRQDDWRPRRRRRPARAVRTTLGVLFASLTVGGVVFATSGSPDSPRGGREDRPAPPPATTAPATPNAPNP